jgi:exodeoxyribonuclease VII large subunit
VRWLTGRLEQAGPEPQLQRLAQRLDELERRLSSALPTRFARQARQVANLQHRLGLCSPARRLAALAQQEANLRQRLAVVGPAMVARSGQRLALAMRTLDAVSPLATLARGYALVTDERGRLVTDSDSLSQGDRVEVALSNGAVIAEVRGVRK